MKVFVVIEKWWDGNSYSTDRDDVSVFSNRDSANNYLQGFQKQMDKADLIAEIIEKDVEE